jgi:isocitrate dehydrogenase (NAD+)
MRKVVFIQGGGAGIDQEQSVRAILAAAGVAVEFTVYSAGRAALDQGRDALSDEAFAAIKAGGVALKTKLLQPKGPVGPAVPANFNVEFRRRLGLFASVRPVRNLAGLPSRFTGINYLLVREITEDLYAASEHEIVPGVVQSFKIVTETACLRFFRFAFDLASRHGKKTVHCIHKANILKLADGLFLDCFRTVAKDFPDIATKELIVDNTCMQLVTRPQQFEVLAAGNLYGDLLGDLGAGLVGGISATAAVNHGAGVKVYEAVYGASAEQVPPGTANPLPLVLPAIEMVRDFGETAVAYRIRNAVEAVLVENKIRPADLGGAATTADFTAAIVSKL